MMTKKLILASASPRRYELMQKLGIPFTVDPSTIDEDVSLSLPPVKLAEQLSLLKVDNVAKRHNNAIVIGADTIVGIDNKVLGKPESLDDAKRMLRLLSGRTHRVITGFTIMDTLTKRTITQSAISRVTFRVLNDREIDSYIHEINVFDKAGAYAIQEGSTKVVDRYDGDYDNIVGLPVKAVTAVLHNIGFSHLHVMLDS